jgi:hypothetical protein
MSNPPNELNTNVMFRLIRELWLETENAQGQISNIGRRLFEISKGGIPKETVMAQWDLLLEHQLVEPIAKDLNLYQFTPRGKSIQTEKDLQEMFGVTE